MLFYFFSHLFLLSITEAALTQDAFYKTAAAVVGCLQCEMGPRGDVTDTEAALSPVGATAPLPFLLLMFSEPAGGSSPVPRPPTNLPPSSAPQLRHHTVIVCDLLGRALMENALLQCALVGKSPEGSCDTVSLSRPLFLLAAVTQT